VARIDIQDAHGGRPRRKIDEGLEAQAVPELVERDGDEVDIAEGGAPSNP